jgi:hypothetical protein
MMKIRSEDFRFREGDKGDPGRWSTNVEPIFNSKKHHKELLEEHVEKLSKLPVAALRIEPPYAGLKYVSTCGFSQSG